MSVGAEERMQAGCDGSAVWPVGSGPCSAAAGQYSRMGLSMYVQLCCLALLLLPPTICLPGLPACLPRLLPCREAELEASRQERLREEQERQRAEREAADRRRAEEEERLRCVQLGCLLCHCVVCCVTVPCAAAAPLGGTCAHSGSVSKFLAFSELIGLDLPGSDPQLQRLHSPAHQPTAKSRSWRRWSCSGSGRRRQLASRAQRQQQRQRCKCQRRRGKQRCSCREKMRGGGERAWRHQRRAAPAMAGGPVGWAAAVAAAWGLVAAAWGLVAAAWGPVAARGLLAPTANLRACLLRRCGLPSAVTSNGWRRLLLACMWLLWELGGTLLLRSPTGPTCCLPGMVLPPTNGLLPSPKPAPPCSETDGAHGLEGRRGPGAQPPGHGHAADDAGE